ncbi:MAG: hypothetical protein QNJ94_14575 [Alphaproteobacteria bacterium]|nr:hypothetical protein [Alphaproteobacteria bacterium]
MLSGPDIDDRRTAEDRLSALRAQLAVIEGLPEMAAGGRRDQVLPFASVPGLTGLAEALPWAGLPRPALHEVIAAGPAPADAAATGFCAALLGALALHAAAPVLWIVRDTTLYGPGLAAFGLDPARLVLVRAPRNRDVLWAMEEGLRSPALAAVLGEADDVSLFASRRLQLAAEGTGVTGLLLRRAGSRVPPPSAAVTRWRVQPIAGEALQASDAIVRTCWQVELLRCRGGRPGTWIIDFRTEEDAHGRTTDSVPVPALLRDGSDPPRRAAG